MSFRSENRGVEQALVKCGEDRGRLRSALIQIERWSEEVDDDLSTEAELRERMELIRRFAGEAKDIGL